MKNGKERRLYRISMVITAMMFIGIFCPWLVYRNKTYTIIGFYCAVKNAGGISSFAGSDVIKVLMKLKEEYPRYYENSVDINSVIVPNDESIKIFDFYRYEDLFKDIWAVNGTLVNDVGYKGMFTKSETFLQAYNYEYFLVLMARLSRISSKFTSTFLEDRFLYVKELRNCKQRCIENTLPEKWHHGGPCIPGEKALFLSTSGYYYPCERVNETSENAIIGNVETGVDVNRVRKVINVEHSKDNIKEQQRTENLTIHG